MVRLGKSGAELTLNTVIIAIIVLIVLALLVYLVLNQFGVFKTGTSCLNKGGTCVSYGTSCEKPIAGDKLCGDDQNNRQICCKIG